jgi:Icc-related predicted phosphoesterase
LDESSNKYHIGCRELLKAVSSVVKPRLHLFGHVHGDHGQFNNEKKFGRTLFVNASLCDSKFRTAHSPIVIDLNRDG